MVLPFLGNRGHDEDCGRTRRNGKSSRHLMSRTDHFDIGLSANAHWPTASGQGLVGC
jgi:hypothetical protein